MLELTVRAIEELEPGARWQQTLERTWPAYRAWYLSEGDAARPSYATSVRMLRAHMPELMPAFEHLVELAWGDQLVGRMLTMYGGPPTAVGCSQAAWTRGGPMLVRNYDYDPASFEGVVFSTRLWARRVMGTSDCLWGLLDGVNEDGLVASLTFGGRRAQGDGFAMPLVIRYMLETCATAAEARDVLARVPFRIPSNVTLLDRSGDQFTAFCAPDREPALLPVPVATNHQLHAATPAQEAQTGTLEREAHLLSLLERPGLTRRALEDAFLRPPVYSQAFATGFGTLYTAAYDARRRSVTYRWPDRRRIQRLAAFEEWEETVTLGAAAA